MAARPKPVILVLSIGTKFEQDMCDDLNLYGAGLNNLMEHADLKRARTVKGALAWLDKNAASQPDGILVTDPGMAQPAAKELLDRVVEYARVGSGIVVVSYCFSSNIDMDDMKRFWKKAWNLPWEPASYQRAKFTLNDSASTLQRHQVDVLQKVCSQKSLCLKNVLREHCWYLPTEESRTQSAVFPPDRVNQNETAVAFAPIGQGHVGYTGDVNMEAGTHIVVKSMFGL